MYHISLYKMRVRGAITLPIRIAIYPCGITPDTCDRKMIPKRIDDWFGK
jgi:hypothetical protein